MADNGSNWLKIIKFDENEKLNLKWPVKKAKAPWIVLKLKNLFTETVQQDARNIFYVADFLFRSNCRLYFVLYRIFYLRLHFPVFLTNSYIKSHLKSYSDKKTYFTLVFLNQGWLPLLKIIKINTLQLILVFILSEKSENIADFSKS